jgi:hypothetical protein
LAIAIVPFNNIGGRSFLTGINLGGKGERAKREKGKEWAG